MKGHTWTRFVLFNACLFTLLHLLSQVIEIAGPSRVQTQAFRTFLKDYPSMFLVGFGLGAVLFLAHRLRRLSMSIGAVVQDEKPWKILVQNQPPYVVLQQVLLALLSVRVNDVWVKSQLSDLMPTWATINGHLHLPWLHTAEGFNLAGLVFYILCLLHWHLFFMALWHFVECAWLVLRHGSVRTRLALMKSFLNSATMFMMYALTYYISLQINDILLEGISTFYLRPSRWLMLGFSFALAVLYSVLSTILSFNRISKGQDYGDVEQHYIKGELYSGFLSLAIPLFIFFIYLFAGMTLFEDHEVKVKAVIGFLLFLVSVIFLIYSEFTKRQRSESLGHLLADLEGLSRYARSVDELYREIRYYRHDMANILLSIRGLLQDKQYTALERYLEEDLLKAAPLSDQSFKYIAALEAVEQLTVKGLILSKALEAHSNGIKFIIEMGEGFSIQGVSESDFCRILGNLLDNAIEAAAQASEKTIFLRGGKDMDTAGQSIAVYNTYTGHADVTKLFDFEFSTKGHNRGLGLSSLKRIVQKHEGLSLATRVEKSWFCQILTLK